MRLIFDDVGCDGCGQQWRLARDDKAGRKCRAPLASAKARKFVQARPTRQRHRPFLSLALLLLPLTHSRLFCALHYRTFSDTSQSLFCIFYTLAVADLTFRSLHFVICSLTPVTTETSQHVLRRRIRRRSRWRRRRRLRVRT